MIHSLNGGIYFAIFAVFLFTADLKLVPVLPILSNSKDGALG